MKKLIFAVLISFLFLIFGCSKNDTAPKIVSEKRSFYMGTTPWSADLTVNEVEKTYQFINNHCDIISQHFDEGIPYEEAYTNSEMPLSLLENVAFRKEKTVANKKIFLSVAALSIDRISKAPYFNNSLTPINIKNYWEQLSFDDSKVVTAYVNYIDWLIDQFHPVYVNYGVESNGQFWNENEFVKYKSFLSQVYQQLKINHPNIPFFISFIVDESSQGYNFASQLVPLTDFIGLSAYPYVSVSSSVNGNTNPQNFPTNYFDKFINLSISKPLAFAETGYIAQDLTIPAYGLNKQGNSIWQNEYLEKVLQLCKSKKAKLFIWFCPKDYDALITNFQNQGVVSKETLNLLKLWRDTGLIDENGIERPAYATWLSWMQLEKE